MRSFARVMNSSYWGCRGPRPPPLPVHPRRALIGSGHPRMAMRLERHCHLLGHILKNMQDLSNHTMDETISPSSNVDSSTTSDIRARPTSNNSGHCSERHTGSYSKNRGKTTPLKPIRKSKRRDRVDVQRLRSHIRCMTTQLSHC